MSTFIWIPGSGRIEIEIEFADLDQCRRVSHPGPCDLDVADLSTEPSIAAQLAAIDPALLRAELQEYGAWDGAELADHAQNLQRVLWIAASDVHEQPEMYAKGTP